MTIARTPDEVRVQLLGAAQVEVGASAVPLTPLQLALVTLVYGHEPDGLSRPAAARLLWDDEAGGRGRQRIRQLLLDIRTRVGRRLIDTHGDVLRPQLDVTSDLQAFEAALLQGRLHEAATLIRSGFIVTAQPPAEPYDDWRSARGARLVREVKTRAFTRWSRAFERGNWLESLDAAEALYTLDPNDPAEVRRVIEARALAGQLDAAETAFNTHVASLPSGSEPMGDLMETIQRVRSAREVDTSARDEAAPVRLVGRRAVLRAARDALQAVEHGNFEFLLISGESGIGKTRVLDEIHREARLRDFLCLRARAVELERSIPLNPLLDALSGIDLEPHLTELGQPWSSVVASLLPAGALDHPREEPPPIQPSSLSRRLLDSFSLLFERLAAMQPTVLFIDDLQWADATTVATLQFMQRRWSRGPLGVFGTVRPELVRPDDAVAKYLSAKAGLQVRRIELEALSTAEAVELVDVIAGGEVGEERAQRLCSITGRHPLYLTELTRDLIAGRLDLPERPVDHVTIPTSLEQMLDSRLEAMSERAMRVAGLLAVAAKPLRVTDVAALSGLALDAATSAVDALVRARFVVVEHTQVGVAHELFRSAIYRHLTEPRRALHHRAIAQHLLATSQEDAAGEVAVHFARAGEPELAAEHGWSAARRALAAGALAEAIQFFDVVAESEPDPVKRADATAELARALYLSRDITAANPKLGLAAERLRATGRPHLARRMEIKRVEGLAEVAAAPLERLLETLGAVKCEARNATDWETVALALDAELHLLHRKGDIDAIRGVLGQMRQVSTTPVTEARLLSKAGLALGVFFDDPKEALVSSQQAVELATESQGYRLRALVRLMIVLHAGGKLNRPESSEVVEEARALALRAGDVMERFAIESNVAVSLLDEGDVEQAEVLMTDASSVAGAGEMDLHRFIRANNRAELALAHRDFPSAALAFIDASSFLGPTTPNYMRDLVAAGLGYCALETGDLAAARRHEADLNDPPKSWYFDPTILLTFRARLLERRGAWREAIGVLEGAAADLDGRLVLAWFKLRLLQARLMMKHGHGGASELAREAGQRAEEAGLTIRAQEFGQMAARASGIAGRQTPPV